MSSPTKPVDVSHGPAEPTDTRAAAVADAPEADETEQASVQSLTPQADAVMYCHNDGYQIDSVDSIDNIDDIHQDDPAQGWLDSEIVEQSGFVSQPDVFQPSTQTIPYRKIPKSPPISEATGNVHFVPRTIFDFGWPKKAQMTRDSAMSESAKTQRKKTAVKCASKNPETCLRPYADAPEARSAGGAEEVGYAEEGADAQPFSHATSEYLRSMFGGPQSKRIERLLVKYLETANHETSRAM